jgi:rare lipoprotein A
MRSARVRYLHIYGLLWALLTLLHGCASAPVSQSLPPTSDATYRGTMPELIPAPLDEAQDGPPEPINRALDEITDAVPQVEPLSKYGNPPVYYAEGQKFHVMRSSEGYAERGIASWYGRKFQGRRTSSGEPYDPWAMTAAHTRLPIPTYVQVTNLDNGKKVVVKVNDRGPFRKNRVLDLSYAAASKLGITGKGTGRVEVRALDPRDTHTTQRTRATTPPATAKRAVTPLQVGHPARHYVQIAAFAQRVNAENLRERVNQHLGQAPVHIDTLESNGAPVYRVRVGPLDAARSRHTVQTLAALGIGTPRIVTETPTTESNHETH